MKISPVEAQTDTRTDLKKPIVAFRNQRTRLIEAQSLHKVTPCTSDGLYLGNVHVYCVWSSSKSV